MEDLLASIRRAIHEDIGEVPSQSAPIPKEAPFKGQMRELRVRVGEDTRSAAAEIQELRNRIQKNREAELPPMRTISPAPLPPRPPANAGFADILSGDSVRPSQLSDFEPRNQEPPLRKSFAETELRNVEYRREEPRYLPPPERAPIVSGETAAATASAFDRLAETILARATGDRSVEDMTRELLRAMLKQWLDENLPVLVEKLVREEIERVARRGR